MTIREFAKLCSCNPQTLRYYDHVGLLKPASVDQWSRYRYYEEDQALVFVKIKNLQRAGFTIEEIRGLLDQDDSVVYQAFDKKIAVAERRLREIQSIQQSYQTEMTTMINRISTLRERLSSTLAKYDPTEEFGIDQDTFDTVIHMTNDVIEHLLQKPDAAIIEESDADDPEAPAHQMSLESLMNNPSSTLVFDKHCWQHVKDYCNEISQLDDKGQYVLLFHLDDDKAQDSVPFLDLVFGLLVMQISGKDTDLTLSITRSADDQNHFWLFRVG